MPASFRNKNSSGSSGSRHGSRRNVLSRVSSNGVVPATGHVTPSSLRSKDRRHPTYDSRHEMLEKEFTQQQFQLPTAICTRQVVPTHATFALTKISSLLQYISPGTLVAFDIDDTLIRKTTFGCSLLTSMGTRKFGEFLKNQFRSASFAEKQDVTNALYRALSSFVLAEDETASVVRALQDRGAYVFGLTARSNSLSSITTSSLEALGIDLRRTAPPTLPLRVIDEETKFAVADGIVYCNDLDKGKVFQRLLSLGWLTWPNTNSQDAHHCDTHPHSEDGGACPQRSIWFVDDNLPMVAGMINEWTVMAENQIRAYSAETPPACRGKMSLVCCHYTHPLATATPPVPAEHLEECIHLQIEEFILSRRLLTDQEALQILEQRKQHHS